MTLDNTDQYSETDIAIVGLAGRFPGAENTDELWQNLKNGINSIEPYDEQTLLDMGLDKETISAPDFVGCGALLPDQDKFDAAFFGYSPREAEELDPQQRLFLETAWQAMESAGYNGDSCDFPVGVYGGCGVNTYLITNLMQSGRFNDLGNISSLQALMNGNNKDAMTMTLAYKLNLKGPAVTVQTACSTSLSAVHMACRSLLNYEADMALAGGAWLNLLHKGGYVYQSGAILSPDGHCRPFDEKAQGTVIGSGSGVVVLKRLEQAIEDGDTIYAVIKGSAMNNDGNNKVGYTAPSVDGQAEVIASAQEMADTPADTISYIEAHGTGTVMGDPIEIAALTQAFRQSTDKSQYCAIGSVKSNLGHLDAAAGVTGLIKTVLALKNGVIPPSLHYQNPNPEIDFTNSPFFVADKAMEWDNSKGPRRAGVSSFGIGGTNVHVILEQAPAQASTATQRDWQVLPLSAPTKTALEQRQQDLATWLENANDKQWQDAAYTLQVGRKHFSQRSVLIAENKNQANANLTLQTSQYRIQNQLTDDHEPAVAFMFPGQGAQYVNMARTLYHSEPVFKAQFDLCREGLTPHLGLDIADLIFVDDKDKGEQLKQTSLTQPVLFAVEYALAKQWMAFGVNPEAMIGHSIGEYVAACLAGVFSLEDTLKIVAKRGQLIQAQPKGCMLSVALEQQKLTPYLAQGCELAAVNGAENCVLSGSDQAISAVEAKLNDEGVAVQRLHVSHAFHSSLVSGACEELASLIATLPRHAPKIPFVSNVSGSWITPEQAMSPDYWAAHLAQTVHFHQGLQTITEKANTVLLEVGPSNALSQLAGRNQEIKAKCSIIASLPHPQKLAEEPQHFATAIGRLWLCGVNINWDALYQQQPKRIGLPVYPFERKRFWVEAQPQALANTSSASNSMQGKPLDEWFYMPSFNRELPITAEQQLVNCTLLLADSGDISAQLETKLANHTNNLIKVRTGAEFNQVSEFEFTINPSSDEDMTQLLSKLKQSYGGVDKIYHMWSANLDSKLRSNDIQVLGLMSLLSLTRALESNQASREVDLVVVGQGVLDVTGQDKISAAQAMLIGPCKVIPQEYPHIKVRFIDFGTGFNPIWLDWLTSETQQDKDTLAYRNHNRWVLDYLPTNKPSAQHMYRKNGTYLITGGLGGVGSVMAEHLAQTQQANLILLGRSAPSPEQQTWLNKLEQVGAKVMVKQVDIADEEQMQQMANEAKANFGDINGIIHAAGNGATNVISNSDAQFVDEMLTAKVQGTDLLLQLFGEQPLDFVVLCSSLASIAGGLSKAVYASANAYLDSVAQSYAQQVNYPVIAINWDSWRTVGMAADMEMPEGVGIEPEQGIEVMQRVLSAPVVPQILVSTVDLSARLVASKSNMLELDLDLAPSEPKTSGYARPDLSTPYVAPQDELQQQIADIWSAMLGIEQIGIHDNLFELGGDSLLGVQMLSKVRADFSVELPPAAFFKEPTILGLSELVTALLIQQLEDEVVAEAGV